MCKSLNINIQQDLRISKPELDILSTYQVSESIHQGCHEGEHYRTMVTTAIKKGGDSTIAALGQAADQNFQKQIKK